VTMDYDDFLTLARSRRSIRKFSERDVSREEILRVLEAGRWAPSNHNRQPWRFIVVEDKTQIVRLAERVSARLSEKLSSLPSVASGYAGEFAQYATFFSRAPVLMVVLHKRPVSFSNALLEGVNHPDLVSGEPLSVAMAVQNLLLAAHTLGLGGCVLTAPLIVQEAIPGELCVPTGYDVTCLLALGYPGEEPQEPRRKSIEQIVQFMNDRG
jgi:nitroreductase